MDTIHLLALTLGTAWASGINLYAAVFMLGFLASTGHVTLPAGLEVLSDPLVIGAAGVMYCIEFFADKTPGVDTAWDTVHTFIRIPAGAVLAAGAVGQTDPAVEVAAFLLGGTLAAGVHAAKAGSRVLINTSPEPVSNWTASFSEDLLVIAGIWTALNHPWIFLGALSVFVVLLLWMLPKLWRGITRIGANIRAFFGHRTVLEKPPLSTGSGPAVDD